MPAWRGMALAYAVLGFLSVTASAQIASPSGPEPEDALDGAGQSDAEAPAPPNAQEPAAKAAKERGAPVTDPALDPQLVLGELYKRLATAPDAQTAERIAAAIEQVWAKSGSPTTDLLIERATQALAADDAELSLSLLDAVVELDPSYPEGWTQRANVNVVKRDYGKSIEDLRQALALDPKHFNAIMSLAGVMREIGEKKGALRAYRAALKVHPFLDAAKEAVEELTREVEGQGI